MKTKAIQNDLYKNYMYDLCLLLKEKAQEAKIEKDRSLHTDEKDYQLGRLMAYHEIISLIKGQACAFDIDPKLLGLEDVDPERDVL